MFTILSDYLKGIAIGAGAILPGISSGVFCVIFGIYEKLLNSVLHFFQDWKKHFRFLLPLVLGGVTGIVLLGNVLQYLFSYYPSYTKFAFLGFIIGTIPALFKQVHHKKSFRLHYLLYLFATFLLALFLLFLERMFTIDEEIYCMSTFSFSFLVFAGFIMSAGVVIPGVSSTVLLLLLGVYQTYLAAVSNLNLSILVPMLIGLILGGLLLMKLIQVLLTNYPCQTYYAIIGFVLGSLPILFPSFHFDIPSLIGLLLFGACFLTAHILEKE